jgi:hypothetical protein
VGSKTEHGVSSCRGNLVILATAARTALKGLFLSAKIPHEGSMSSALKDGNHLLLRRKCLHSLRLRPFAVISNPKIVLADPLIIRVS